MPTHADLRDVLKSEEPLRQDLVIASSVLISCIAIDERDHSWVLPYIHLAPSRFMESKFELCFANVVVNVTLKNVEQEPIETILQAVAEWRLSLIAHGDRFAIQVRLIED